MKHSTGICVLLAMILSCATAATNPNGAAWQLLMENKPFEAQRAFLENTGSDNDTIAGEAFRGLSQVSEFLGDGAATAQHIFQAYLKDRNTAWLATEYIRILDFARYAEGHGMSEGYKVLKKVSAKPGLFTGNFQENLAYRYLNDGKVRAARSIVKDMGCINEWMCIGPFDNISRSGYYTEYPPEHEIDFSKTYPAKDGNQAAWHPLKGSDLLPWIFVENHIEALNAVNYFYCTVESNADQSVYCSFGASGMFKIFLNNTCILADSMFRNTGNDMFMQRVNLHKGANPLLIKLGHELGVRLASSGKLSNFSIRFLDSTFAPLKNISTTRTAAAAQGAPQTFATLAPSPITDTLARLLNARLAADPGDIDAACMLVNFYNGMEMTDKAQVLAASYLKKFPASALWHQILSETFNRSKKYTEADKEMKTAFEQCPLNFAAWMNKLHSMTASGDFPRVLSFIDAAPDHLKNALPALIARFYASFKTGKQAEALACLNEIEERHALTYEALEILASVYLNQGMAKKAEKLIKRFLKYEHMRKELYQTLAEQYVKSGDMSAGFDYIEEGLVYNPANPSAYYFLAMVSFYNKNYAKALGYINECIALMPANSNVLNLKGNILIAQGRPVEAEQAFSDVIKFTDDDFKAWDNLRSLRKQKPLDSLMTLPAVDSLIAAAQGWDARTYENGAMIATITDIFLYPSRCSRERRLMIVHVPTEKAIDTWKQYTIEYNDNYQALMIAQAYSRKADGSIVEADVHKNTVVFKSLQPGDCVVLEWSLSNYYIGDMARQVWGSMEFQLDIPAFDSRLRLATPQADTIPYKVYGDSIERTQTMAGDYCVTVFSRKPYQAQQHETFAATDWPQNKKVSFSTFSGWDRIAAWYASLTGYKHESTMELDALADSLFAPTQTPAEKIAAVHSFITGNIRYSFVPFRQSGWVPQSAQDVLATRIGDCKDMASLGKKLLERAGIAASLVLVNTHERHYVDHACIGPDFNHCILAYTLDGTERFLDLTDNDAAMNTLPLGDQGAMALVIKDGTTALITLPVDAPSQRQYQRTLAASLDTAGTLVMKVATLRTGLFANRFRNTYRYEPEEQKRIILHKTLTDEYSDLTLDDFTMGPLNVLADSLRYSYAYTARNAVSFSNTTAIFSFKIPNNVTASDFPVEENRRLPIDMVMISYAVSLQTMHAEIVFPASWKMISLPKNVTISSAFGSYSLSFSMRKNTIICDRKAEFSMSRQISISEYPKMKEFLTTVAKADDVQFLFFTK